MSSVPIGTSAFASSLASATTVSTLLSWLENELRAEQQALDHALKVRHQGLLKRLESVVKDTAFEWPSSTPSFALTGTTSSPGTKNVWVQGSHVSVLIGQRHHCPPAEPSSPSSSFLFEDRVPDNAGHIVNGTDQHLAGEYEQIVDEHIVQTPVLNGMEEERADRRAHQKSPTFMSDMSCEPFDKQTASPSISENSCATRSVSPKSKNKKFKGTGPELRMSKTSLDAKTREHAFPWLVKFVLSGKFEATFAMLILLNTITMAIEAQYRGMQNGFVVEYDKYESPAADLWPGMAISLEVLEWIFGLAFTLQLVLRLICMHVDFFRDVWNLIDAVIVGSWLFSVASQVQLEVDPLLLRLARLVRLLRLLRLVRTFALFDALYLMTTAIQSSLSTLVWSILLLMLFLIMIGLLLQKLVEPYVVDSNNPIDRRLQVFMFYGTFSRSMLTMFEMTLGNWMPPCRALVENVSEWFMLLFVAQKLVIGFSVVSVINAVFVQETFKVATSDDRIMLMVKQRARRTHLAKIRDLLSYADEDGSGTVTSQELADAMKDPEFRNYLSALDLDIRDATHLFDMLDVNDDGSISLEELSDGMFRLRGAAKSYDVQHLLNHVRHMNKLLVSLNHQVCT